MLSGGVVECRYDWHQTATHVTVAIYAKELSHLLLKEYLLLNNSQLFVANLL